MLGSSGGRLGCACVLLGRVFAPPHLRSQSSKVQKLQSRRRVVEKASVDEKVGLSEAEPELGSALVCQEEIFEVEVEGEGRADRDMEMDTMKPLETAFDKGVVVASALVNREGAWLGAGTRDWGDAEGEYEVREEVGCHYVVGVLVRDLRE